MAKRKKPSVGESSVDPKQRMCTQCRGTLEPLTTGHKARCINCHAVFQVNRGPDQITVNVAGHDAYEVQQVASYLLAQERERQDLELERRRRNRLKSPWASGLFYLFVALVLLGVLLVVAQIAPWWALPLIILGGLLFLTVIGAFQMRQDDRLSEEGFLKLMTEAFVRLPLLVKGGASKPSASPPAQQSADEAEAD